MKRSTSAALMAVIADKLMRARARSNEGPRLLSLCGFQEDLLAELRRLGLRNPVTAAFGQRSEAFEPAWKQLEPRCRNHAAAALLGACDRTGDEFHAPRPPGRQIRHNSRITSVFEKAALCRRRDDGVGSAQFTQEFFERSRPVPIVAAAIEDDLKTVQRAAIFHQRGQ